MGFTMTIIRPKRKPRRRPITLPTMCRAMSSASMTLRARSWRLMPMTNGATARCRCLPPTATDMQRTAPTTSLRSTRSATEDTTTIMKLDSITSIPAIMTRRREDLSMQMVSTTPIQDCCHTICLRIATTIL